MKRLVQRREACVRCSLLRSDPSQRNRLEEIRENFIAPIAEAGREGWLGEVEGSVSAWPALKTNLPRSTGSALTGRSRFS